MSVLKNRVSDGHCPYSDMGTEYGHLRYLLNKKINTILKSK